MAGGILRSPTFRIGCAVFALALLLRLPMLDRSFWSDEVASIRFASGPWGEVTHRAATQDAHPPLFYLLLNVWALFGSSEAWLRGLPLLFGLGTIAVLGRIAFEMAGRRAGWYAAALAATAYGLCWPSYELRSFALMNFCMACAWLLVIGGLKRGGRWRWAGAGACMAAAAYTFYFAAFALLALALFVLAYQPDRKQWTGFGGACLVAALLCVPWLLKLWSLREEVWIWEAAPGGWKQNAPPEFTWKYHFLELGPWVRPRVAGPLLAAGLLVWTCLRRTAHAADQNRWLRATAVCAFLLAFMFVSVFLVTDLHTGRYTTWLAAVWALLLGLALARLGPRVGAAAVVLLALANARYNERLFRHQELANWRGVVAYVGAQSRPGDVVGVRGASSSRPYQYYRPSDHPPVIQLPQDLPGYVRGWWGSGELDAQTLEGTSALLLRHERFWLVWLGSNERPRRGEPALTRSLREAGLEPASRRRFRGISVDLYERPP